MEINSFGINQVRLNNNGVKKAQRLSCSECDSVSFSGKVKNKTGKIPFRLTSKYQDDFHGTMSQVYRRVYLDLKSQGLSDEEIVKHLAKDEKPSSIEEMTQFIDKLKKKIEVIDASFEEIIPSIKDGVYYRGIYDSSGQKNVLDIVKNAKVGDMIIPDNGYPFFTTDYLYAEEFTSSINGHHSPDSSVLMKVKIPKGVRISRDLSYKDNLFDSSIVLPRGARYKVLENKVQHDKNYITLEYIDCATDRGE